MKRKNSNIPTINGTDVVKIIDTYMDKHPELCWDCETDWICEFSQKFGSMQFTSIQAFRDIVCTQVISVLNTPGKKEIYRQLKEQVDKKVREFFGERQVKSTLKNFFNTLDSPEESNWAIGDLKAYGENGSICTEWLKWHYGSVAEGIRTLFGEQQALRIVKQPQRTWDVIKIRTTLLSLYKLSKKQKMPWNRKFVDQHAPSGLTEKLVFQHDSFANAVECIFGQDHEIYTQLEEKREYVRWNKQKAEIFLRAYKEKQGEGKLKLLEMRKFRYVIDGKIYAGRGWIKYVKQTFGNVKNAVIELEKKED